MGKRLMSGLIDTIYWRRSAGGMWHAFKKLSGGRGYVSLCHRLSLAHSGGQKCQRPEVNFRCGRCDVAEMDRRGWDESGPASHPAAPGDGDGGKGERRG